MTNIKPENKVFIEQVKAFEAEARRHKVCPHCGGDMLLTDCQTHKSALYVTELLSALDDVDPKVLEAIEEQGDNNAVVKVTEQRYFCQSCPLASGIRV